MKDFAIDTATNNFLRNGSGFRFTESKHEYLAQKVWSAISLFLGEWFLDASMGIPYLSKRPKGESSRLIEAQLQAKIAGVDGIARISYFNARIDKATRTCHVRFIAIADDGEEIEGRQAMQMGAG